MVWKVDPVRLSTSSALYNAIIVPSHVYLLNRYKKQLDMIFYSQFCRPHLPRKLPCFVELLTIIVSPFLSPGTICHSKICHGKIAGQKKPAGKAGLFRVRRFDSHLTSTLPLVVTDLPTPVGVLTTFACSPSSIFPCIDPKSLDLAPSGLSLDSVPK
jgi:hypothetical protein